MWETLCGRCQHQSGWCLGRLAEKVMLLVPEEVTLDAWKETAQIPGRS